MCVLNTIITVSKPFASWIMGEETQVSKMADSANYELAHMAFIVPLLPMRPSAQIVTTYNCFHTLDNMPHGQYNNGICSLSDVGYILTIVVSTHQKDMRHV